MTRSLGLALAALSAISAVASAQERSSGFTPDERRALLAGELVRRNIRRQEGDHLFYGGTSWQLVQAPIERVWQAAMDPATYSHLIPSLDSAQVVGQAGDRHLVFMRHGLGPVTLEYHTWMRFDASTYSVRFELDQTRPHDMRGGRGMMRLTRYRGGTIVEWGMLADPGSGMLMQLFAPFLDEWLLLPPRCMRDMVEPGRQPTC